MDAVRRHTFSNGDTSTQLTVSMGGAFYPADAQDKVKLIKKADQALYRSKQTGRDRFECCLYNCDQLADLDYKRQPPSNLKLVAGAPRST